MHLEVRRQKRLTESISRFSTANRQGGSDQRIKLDGRSAIVPVIFLWPVSSVSINLASNSSIQEREPRSNARLAVVFAGWLEPKNQKPFNSDRSRGHAGILRSEGILPHSSLPFSMIIQSDMRLRRVSLVVWKLLRSTVRRLRRSWSFAESSPLSQVLAS